jgi:hypothetical protein
MPKQLPQLTDKTGLDLLRMLLANLIDKEDQRSKLKNALSVIDIPEGNVFERVLWQEIEWYWNDGLPASRENVLAGLEGHRELKDKATSMLDTLLAEYATGDDVRNIAGRWRRWNETQKLERAAEKMSAIASRPGGKTAAELGQQMFKVLAEAVPTTGRVNNLTPDDVDEVVDAAGQRVYERFTRGEVVAPTFPWPELNKLITSLNPGDPVLWTATTKSGKSTLAQFLAEHWAWDQGYYVISLEKETSPLIYGWRRMARLIGLPTWVFKDVVRLKTQKSEIVLPPAYRGAKEWAHVFARYDAIKQARQEKKGGVLVHINAPGITPERFFTGEFSAHCENAARMGMEVIVIDDYLQKFDWSHLAREERAGLAKTAATVKNEIQRAGCYAMIFAQEQIIKDQKTGVIERVPFGSREAQKVFQAHLSLQRKQAERDEPVMWIGSQQEKHLTNALGQLRYYARANKGFSAESVIEVVVANDGTPGKFTTMIEGSLFTTHDVHDNPPSYMPLF